MAKEKSLPERIWPIADPYGDAARRTYERYTGYSAELTEVPEMAKSKPKPMKPGKPRPGC